MDEDFANGIATVVFAEMANGSTQQLWCVSVLADMLEVFEFCLWYWGNAETAFDSNAKRRVLIVTLQQRDQIQTNWQGQRIKLIQKMEWGGPWLML